MLRRVGPLVVLASVLACPGHAAKAAEATRDESPLLLGVVSFYYPRLMYLKYQPLVDYLSEQTGRAWELRISTTYQQTATGLCSGALTAAYLGPLTYVRAHAACGAEPVVRLQTGGRDTYQSYILVRDDSDVRELGDLKGKRFAFGSALSTSSHLVPRAMLMQAGIGTDDVRCLYYGHHERAARAVLLGDADACGVRDIVGARFLQRGLRVLAKSEPLPNFPIALAPKAGPEIRRLLTRALVELPRQSPQIARTIATWDEELAGGFVPADNAEYDVVRALAERILGPGALTLSEEKLHCVGRGQ